MKYTLIDNHSNVNFHDAYVNSVYFKENDMVWELVALQTHNIVQDMNDENCYIKNAVMILENAHIDNIIICGYKHYENGILIDSRESVDAPPNEYHDILKNISYKHFSEIYGIRNLHSASQDKFKISIMVSYEIVVEFTKSIIMWDEFGSTEWRQNKWWSSDSPN